jgi:glyoxylase-like metal-dependent hydrolase (beta-lactamase superfamily II)
MATSGIGLSSPDFEGHAMFKTEDKLSHTNHVEQVPNEGWDERVLVFRNEPLVDTFMVITERYAVVVDTMINPATAVILRSHAQQYLINRQLLVVNTHADYDHAWGNQVFDAPIIATRACADLMRSAEARGMLATMQANEPDIFDGLVLTPPTILFDDKLIIDGGDLTLELFATPGHTTDHLAIYIPEIRTLLAADAAELPYPVARTNAGLPAMRQSLAELVARDAESVLYCHAPVTIGPQLLHDNIAYFDKLEEHCRVALSVGLPANPPADTDLAAMISLPYVTAVPATQRWQEVHPYYQTTGHANQIRAMLEYLQSVG